MGQRGGVLSEFSEFVVYANESGDHGLVAIDSQYPVFALVFCAMRKADYIAGVVPGRRSRIHADVSRSSPSRSG